MEAHFYTEDKAALVLGGVPDEESMQVKYALKVPRLLSFLVHNDFTSPVKGLEEFPRDEWPPVAITHYAFQVMIFFGMLMMLIGLVYLYFLIFRKKQNLPNWVYKLFVVATPFGYIALEAGWTVTEVGRQPWIIYGFMKTIDAVTPMPGIQYSFYIFTAIFFSLSIVLVFLMNRQIQSVARLYDPEDPQFQSTKNS